MVPSTRAFCTPSARPHYMTGLVVPLLKSIGGHPRCSRLWGGFCLSPPTRRCLRYGMYVCLLPRWTAVGCPAAQLNARRCCCLQSDSMGGDVLSMVIQRVSVIAADAVMYVGVAMHASTWSSDTTVEVRSSYVACGIRSDTALGLSPRHALMLCYFRQCARHAGAGTRKSQS